ncbi:GGDEF domain-containing protein [Gigaspora margarita]|uniref:GGDEF domain-containing protein n=1 Tax=Gigaspora margarita TaxID=4874 RepID=A0A8H4B2D6_GIGMA|nr:GGDEF domain-containing protein [Gigaspora margarita]
MYVVTDFDLEKYHFKSIYDNYDDGAENYVLEEPSVLIQTLIHPKEIFARYDGNEFAILLKNTNAEFAHIIAEKIQILLKVIHLFTKETITSNTYFNQVKENGRHQVLIVVMSRRWINRRRISRLSKNWNLGAKYSRAIR